MSLNGWDSVILRKDCAKFDAYMSCESGDIRLLFCHAAPRDHITKKTCGLESGIP